LMAKRTGPDGRVFAFEPGPAVRKYLEENIKANQYDHVNVFPFALFSRDGKGVMEGRDNLNACLIPDVGKSSTDLTQFVRFDRLQEKLNMGRVNVIKMDVEGAEMDILIGMQEYLKGYHPGLIIEVHLEGLAQFGYTAADLTAFIQTLGYSISTIWSHIDTTTIYCVKNHSPGGIGEDTL
jgi:FkbM family methyltransferase